MPLRMNSSLLSSLPWSTGILRNVAKLSGSFLVGSDMKGFISRIDAHEDYLFSSSAFIDLQDLQIQTQMGFDVKPVIGMRDTVVSRPNFLSESRLHPAAAMRLFTVLCGYHLVDVLALIEGAYPSETVMERTMAPTNPLPYFHGLKDWVSVVEGFKRTLEREKVCIGLPASQGARPDGLHIPIALLRSISRVHATGKRAKITSNLLSAAMHIAYLRSKDGLNELPDSAQALMVQSPSDPHFSQEDQDFLSEFDLSRDAGLGGLHNALHLAVGITPVCLLLPNDLSNKSVHRHTLIEMTIALGNNKPKPLLAVEKLIWKAVFKLSEGFHNPEVVVEELVHEIPWATFKPDLLQPPQRRWFDIYAPPSQPIDAAPAPGLLPAVATPPPPALQLSSSSVVLEEDMDTNLDHEVQASVHDPDIMDTRADSRELLSTAEPAGDLGGCGTGEEQSPRGDPTHQTFSQEMSATPTRSTTVAEQPNSPSVAHCNRPDLETQMRPVDLTSGVHLSHAKLCTEYITSESDSESDGTTEKNRVFHEAANTIAMRRSARLSSKENPEEKRDRESGVVPNLGTRRSLIRRRTIETRGEAKKSERMGSESSSRSASPVPPVTRPKRKEPPEAEKLLLAGSSASKPIDVDALDAVLDRFPVKRELQYVKHEIELFDIQKPKIGSPREFVIYGGSPSENRRVRAVAHFRDDMVKLESLLEMAVKQYENGVPLHLSSPDRSAFATMTELEFLQLTSGELQEILRQKHILISDCCFNQLDFDAEGLRTLCPPWQTIEVQDQSVQMNPDVAGTLQLLNATTGHLLKASAMAAGKILNALEFPMHLASLTPTPPFSTDLLAWADTATEYPPPIGHIRWGLAATAGARTWFHLDSNGFNTFLDVKCGYKVWICIRDESGRFVAINAFKDFELDDACGYQVEIILLTPGTRFLMRPNTLHAVFTPEASICHGGHFYCTSTMQDTLRAVVHSFVDHIKITNTNHPPASALLRRMATFYFTGLVEIGREKFGGEIFANVAATITDIVKAPQVHHLPDPGTLLGALDLIAFCFLVIFGNVLDFRTYTNARGKPLKAANSHDQNSISLEERVNICLARGVCFELLRWWGSKYDIANHVEAGSSMDSVFATRLLVAQATAVLKYKRAAEKDGREGAAGCTASLLSLQIDNIVEIIPGGLLEWERVHNATKEMDISLGYNAEDWAHVEVLDRQPPQNYKVPADFFPVGCTAYDKAFIDYCGGGATLGTQGTPSTKRVRYSRS